VVRSGSRDGERGGWTGRLVAKAARRAAGHHPVALLAELAECGIKVGQLLRGLALLNTKASVSKKSLHANEPAALILLTIKRPSMKLAFIKTLNAYHYIFRSL
jgi:hypothetical protein